MSDIHEGPDLRRRQFARYFLTGGAAAIVDLGGFHFFVAGGMRIAQAASSSFLFALIVNYFLSARFTFRRDTNIRSFLLFTVFAGGGLLINVGVTLLTFAATSAVLISKIVGIGAAFLFNFFVNSFLVFR